ncbi:hypothetical protein PRK78_006011 [Emydomyces testavorans]|uniref:Protein kinase domain-containing protein n=1 Tax=Emydomyces testavorans TaxID=2070801 RepID=A0AAF0IN64_9EURO|nr:hypothetical protein PRK78_006011 [Emydomyces testavorans]
MAALIGTLDHEIGITILEVDADDLFAFGTVVYDMITDKLPYEDPTDEKLIKLYCDYVFPDVSKGVEEQEE